MTTTTTSHEEPIAEILRVAVAYSRENRGQVVTDLDGFTFVRPEAQWRELIGQRTANGSARTLKAAGRALAELARPTARPYVQRAVKNLLAAVAELAEYRPEYHAVANVVPAAIAKRLSLSRREVTYSTWRPTPASVAELDDLRDRVKVAYIHLEALFEWHDTPAARLLAVAKRVASVILEPTAAKLVGDWLAKLERGDSAAA